MRNKTEKIKPCLDTHAIMGYTRLIQNKYLDVKRKLQRHWFCCSGDET